MLQDLNRISSTMCVDVSENDIDLRDHRSWRAHAYAVSISAHQNLPLFHPFNRSFALCLNGNSGDTSKNGKFNIDIYPSWWRPMDQLSRGGTDPQLQTQILRFLYPFSYFFFSIFIAVQDLKKWVMMNDSVWSTEVWWAARPEVGMGGCGSKHAQMACVCGLGCPLMSVDPWQWLIRP